MSVCEFFSETTHTKLHIFSACCLCLRLSPSLAVLWNAAVVMCLGQDADLHMAQLMPLPLTISCSSKSRLVLPSWFYLSGTGSPG